MTNTDLSKKKEAEDGEGEEDMEVGLLMLFFIK